MTEAAAPPRGRGLPIAVQIGLLLIVSLIAAQAVTVLLILISPPPPLRLYQVGEIARGLQGGALETRSGGRLIRTVEPSAPRNADPRGRFDQLFAGRLAADLQTTPDKVRFAWLARPGRDRFVERYFPLRLEHGVRFGLLRGPPPTPPGPGGPPPGGGFGGPRFQSEVFGGFVAAQQRPDGRWTVVRSHEPLLTAWRQRMVLWLLGCLVVVTPAAWLFARRITAPIHRFADAAQALGRDPRAPSIPLTGSAEIGAAAAAFNEMQARIRRYVADRTAMVGAISHDLRTPLARIRYKLEKAPPELKGAVLADVERMEQMIGSVLAFIREESEPRRRERLDLLSVVECVADDASLTGADVEIAGGWPVQVEGDALALQRMLTNLVDNAVKYGGRARLTLEESGGEALVRVRDEGPGLPTEELERVFTPFYRPGPARTLDDGGVGLGLAVARSIARAHGGDIELASPPEGGLLVTVRLPLAA
jgi:signal transduction histidine kinase